MVVAATVTVAVPAGPALADAAEKASREVRSLWIAADDDARGGEIVLKPGELAFRQNVLPVNLFVLQTEAKDGKSGKVMLPIGAQMFSLQTRRGRIGCAVADRGKTLWNSLIAFGTIRLCLVDDDADGTFDHYVSYNGDVDALPCLNGRLPKTMRGLMPDARYAEQKVDELSTKYFVGVEYIGKSLPGNPVFTIRYGHDDDTSFVQNQAAPVTKLPFLLEIGGAQIVVERIEGSNVVIRVLKTLPKGPFNIYQAGFNRFV